MLLDSSYLKILFVKGVKMHNVIKIMAIFQATNFLFLGQFIVVINKSSVLYVFYSKFNTSIQKQTLPIRYHRSNLFWTQNASLPFYYSLPYSVLQLYHIQSLHLNSGNEFSISKTSNYDISSSNTVILFA